VRRLVSLATLFLALSSFACRGDSPSKHYEVKLDQGGNHATVNVEVAATVGQRQQGLMLRQEMDEDAGMLFLFAQDVNIGFWMHNTYLPLDIAYIGADGKLLEVRQGKPLDETILTPAQKYRYVIEMNQGWFERHHFGTGTQVTLPPRLPAAE
jgi:uncharacterized membrane protein (UPF0127 family)